MPQHEEHCLHSEKRYGIRGDDIHTWMDEPSRVSAGSHRDYRHDLNSLPIAIQVFGKKYGAEMVENIFLDHLKADSEENRKYEQESSQSLHPKMWSKEEDDWLYRRFMYLSDDGLEAELQSKSKTEIRKRREHFGLIRPKVIKRTQTQHRIQRLVFRLKRGQKIHGEIEVTGGNNDIDFGFFTYQAASASSFQPRDIERVCGHKSFTYVASITGNHCFYFSNSFSFVTTKSVLFSYQLENGKKIQIPFTI